MFCDVSVVLIAVGSTDERDWPVHLRMSFRGLLTSLRHTTMYVRAWWREEHLVGSTDRGVRSSNDAKSTEWKEEEQIAAIDHVSCHGDYGD